MSERRWNPTLEQWVLTATHRQDRTFLPPADYCPLCPTAPGAAKEYETDIPAPEYDIAVLENKFPSLRYPAPVPDVEGTELYPVGPGEGVCEVVLYTQQHNETLTVQPLQRIERLVRVWQDRFADLASRPFVDYVFIFENKGKVIGVTIDHPHGQIYAYPFVPPVAKTEIDAARRYRECTGRRLWDDILDEELRDGRRIVASNANWVALIPFYARYPYEVHLMPRRHLTTITEFTKTERWDFARILKVVLQKYDNLWGFSMPYMMVMHQAPTDGGDYDFYRFHVEFYPPHRTETKLKYLAGSESGAGVFINDTLPEVKAEEFRNVEPFYMEP
ncbi:MAG: galactose-1-phosphate uridylyltransferase [Armatimonadetes bacterium]|jgi:UDPglucose--hexose-1-phosphate uridylyltransferase|nr:galactose-1-phosphate uridylyltransferase [Armatimonadota bacterium]